jgi:diguanylate cyclase (GGDEF)-like protein
VWTILAAIVVYLRRGGSVKIAVWVAIASFFSGFMVSAIYTGGFEGPIAPLAPLLPALVIMLLNPKAGWIGAVITLFLLSLVAVLQSSGLTEPLPIGGTGLVIIQYFVAAIACLVFTWIIADFAQKSNEVAATNLQNSRTDFVTGVANRRQINDTLEQEIERAGRSDNHLSVILIDVDHFKRFNDSNGHQAGDQCLSAVAEVLSASAKRSIDVIGRYGGDEFIMILPSTDASSAARIVEKVRSGMLSRSLYYDSECTDKVSLTLGVASLQGRAIKSAEHLVKLADDALLHGKANGRNTIFNTIFDARSGLATFKGGQPSASF